VVLPVPLLPIKAQWLFSSRVKAIFSNSMVLLNPNVSFSALIMVISSLRPLFPVYHKGILPLLQVLFPEMHQPPGKKYLSVENHPIL
jgi:hypothetical protein